MQAPMFDGFLFNPFALFYDGFSSSEVGISGRDVVEAFVIALMVVMLCPPSAFNRQAGFVK